MNWNHRIIRLKNQREVAEYEWLAAVATRHFQFFGLFVRVLLACAGVVAGGPYVHRYLLAVRRREKATTEGSDRRLKCKYRVSTGAAAVEDIKSITRAENLDISKQGVGGGGVLIFGRELPLVGRLSAAEVGGSSS